MADELLDLVNDRDEVIGAVMKNAAHAEGKTIRIVHVFLFNSKGELAMQLRSQHVHFAPGHWVTSGSGHVQRGETYEDAGKRETAEEIGVTVPLVFEGKEDYVDARTGGHEWLGVMRGTYDGEFTIHQDEVERVEWRSLEQVQDMIDQGEKFHPEFLFLLRKRFGLK